MNIFRPEYFFRPSQLARRLAYGIGLTRCKRFATTPWGTTIKFDPGELHGRAMLTHGLSDLRTNEIISRVVRPGDIAVDIGANIGIMSSLMAVRAGPNGSVYAFEPHPETRALLEYNAAAWRRKVSNFANIHVLRHALSNEKGGGVLYEPSSFAVNSGLSSLESSRRSHNGDSIQVETLIFDEWARELANIRLVKIDVEGHEDAVLEGMRSSLENGNIDFILFEEMRPLPSAANDFLKQFGYVSYLIDRSQWGPQLIDVAEQPKRLAGEATNILAVRCRDEASLLNIPGWSCLS